MVMNDAAGRSWSSMTIGRWSVCVCDVLREAGYDARSANSGAEALGYGARGLPRSADLGCAHEWDEWSSAPGRAANDLVPDLPVVIITAFGSIEIRGRIDETRRRSITSPSHFAMMNSCWWFPGYWKVANCARRSGACAETSRAATESEISSLPIRK